jgi:carboxypeptidase Taq
MQRLIGVRPPDHKDGCMQDTHWFGGSFGYFPTYTLGAVAAAQLFQAAARQADLLGAIAEGDFAPLMEWLKRNVHGRGCLHADHNALLTAATGRPLEVAPFIRHLRARYDS